MRKVFIFFIAGVFMFIFISVDTNNENKYYYAFSNKVIVVPQKSRILVKYSEGIDKSKTEQELKKIEPGLKVVWRTQQVAEITSESFKPLDNLLRNINLQKNIYSCQYFYKTADGLERGVTDEILVRFLPDISDKQKLELLEKFKTKVVKTTAIYQKLIIPKGADVFEIANRYYESGLVEFSTPNFFTDFKVNQVIPNDTYFNYQITCNNCKFR